MVAPAAVGSQHAHKFALPTLAGDSLGCWNLHTACQPLHICSPNTWHVQVSDDKKGSKLWDLSAKLVGLAQ